MATITIEVSEATKRWMDEDASDIGLGDASGFVRAMIQRQEEKRREKIAHMQQLVDEGRASGVSTRTMEEIRAEARKEAITAGYAL